MSFSRAINHVMGGWIEFVLTSRGWAGPSSARAGAWDWGLMLRFDFLVWGCSLMLKYKVKTWNGCLKLKFDMKFEVKVWGWSLEFRFEMCRSRLNLKFAISKFDVVSWSSSLTHCRLTDRPCLTGTKTVSAGAGTWAILHNIGEKSCKIAPKLR